MPASKEFEVVLKKIRARAAEVRHSLNDDRISYERLVQDYPILENTDLEPIGAGGVPALWITAPNANRNRAILYFHGGGFVIGSNRTHSTMLSYLSRDAATRVLGLDYRLAPENPFPAQLEDAIASYRWLLSQGFQPENIVIAGDSAGGGLTISALVALRYLGEPLPAAGICISPWVDLQATGKTYESNASVDPSVSRDRTLNMAKVVLAGKNPSAPFASPLHADLSGLPPLLVQVGSVEVLVDDSKMLVEKAKAHDVKADLEIWEYMTHVWHQHAPFLPEALDAIQSIGSFVKEHVS